MISISYAVLKNIPYADAEKKKNNEEHLKTMLPLLNVDEFHK